MVSAEGREIRLGSYLCMLPAASRALAHHMQSDLFWDGKGQLCALPTTAAPWDGSSAKCPVSMALQDLKELLFQPLILSGTWGVCPFCPSCSNLVRIPHVVKAVE